MSAIPNTSKIEKPTIAILINSMSGGGAERVVSVLLAALSKRYAIHLILLDNEVEYEVPEGQIIKILSGHGSVMKSDLANILSIPAAARKLTAYCIENKIDLVLSFLPRANFIACLAKKRGLKAKVLISERIYTPKWYRRTGLRGRLGRLLISRLYPLADAILPNSNGTERALRDEFGVESSYVVVRNPVPVAQIQERAKEEVDDLTFDRFTFICVAGFRAQKNYRVLIDAFADMSGDNVQLLLVGDGELRAPIEAQVAAAGLSDQVFFLGHQRNPFKYVSRADCLVLASEFEGFPNVLLEAMACGTPIISTDCLTGPRELLGSPSDQNRSPIGDVEICKYGVLVPVGNAAKMTIAMRRLMSDSSLRETLKKAGVERVSDYDQISVGVEFENIISRYLVRP